MLQTNCPRTLSLSHKAAGNSGAFVLDDLCNYSPGTGAEVSSSGPEGALCSLAGARPVAKSNGEESPNRDPPLPPSRQLPLTGGRATSMEPLFATGPVPHTRAPQILCGWGAVGNLWTRKSGSRDDDNEDSCLLCPRPLSVTPFSPVPPAESQP